MTKATNTAANTGMMIVFLLTLAFLAIEYIGDAMRATTAGLKPLNILSTKGLSFIPVKILPLVKLL